MALGKMLNLGGIDNRPPKANQTMGRFRVARNVMPTPDGRIIPRYDWEQLPVIPTRIKATHLITQYDNSSLAVVSRDFYNTGDADFYQLYKDGVMVAGMLGYSPMVALANDINNSAMSYRKNNTTYFLTPGFSQFVGQIAKYDGVQVWKAGADQPKISTATATGTNYNRVIQHTMDFDNNEAWSEFVEFRTTGASYSLQLCGDFATNMITSARADEPNSVITTSGRFSAQYIGTSSYNAGTFDYTIAITDTTIDTTHVGEYVFVSWDSASAVQAASGFPGYALAMKIKAAGASITLDATGAKYLDINREWQDCGATLVGLGALLTQGTQSFLSSWRGSSATGIYYFAGFYPSFPDLSVSSTVTVDTSSLVTAVAGSDLVISTLGPQLNTIYDVTSKKISPNANYPFGLNHQFYCMTNFQDQLLFASDDLIWLSDPTLGGGYEQLNTSAFIRVGDTEFGRITSICGTQDFLFVSRERRNYYVTGNISTGNYRVQEIIEAEIGAWSNVASINVKDSVIFLTALGVFQVVGGGKASLLSETCPKNFATYDAVAVNEDVVFRMTGFVSDITNASVDGLSVAYDEFRELLVFMKKGVTGSPCFVIHTKTGEAYEWNGMADYSTQKANCIGFINAEYYLGTVDSAVAYNAILAVENNALIQSFPTDYPIKLYTTWLTGGEPSLEKAVLQLKVFGRFQSSTTVSSVKVCSYKDWDISTKITDSYYFPQDTTLSLTNQKQYSHKKRLNSDKVLSISVGLEIATTASLFEIESLEVEFMPIQDGMKR